MVRLVTRVDATESEYAFRHGMNMPSELLIARWVR